MEEELHASRVQGDRIEEKVNEIRERRIEEIVSEMRKHLDRERRGDQSDDRGQTGPSQERQRNGLAKGRREGLGGSEEKDKNKGRLDGPGEERQGGAGIGPRC